LIVDEDISLFGVANFMTDKIQELLKRVLVDVGALVGLLLNHVEDQGDEGVVIVIAKDLLAVLGQFGVALF
jgi:hypothetical protein